MIQKELKSSAKDLLEARKEKMAVEIDLKNFELSLKRGDFMPVSEHVRISCAKLYLIRDTVQNWIRENGHELISVVKGDPILVDELIYLYQDSFEKYWSRLDTGIPWPILSSEDYDAEI